MRQEFHGIIPPAPTRFTAGKKPAVNGRKKRLARSTNGGAHRIFRFGATGGGSAPGSANRRRTAAETVRGGNGEVSVPVGIATAIRGIRSAKDSPGNMPDFHEVLPAPKDREGFSRFIKPGAFPGKADLCPARTEVFRETPNSTRKFASACTKQRGEEARPRCGQGNRKSVFRGNFIRSGMINPTRSKESGPL